MTAPVSQLQFLIDENINCSQYTDIHFVKLKNSKIQFAQKPQMLTVCFIDRHNGCFTSRGKACSWRLITFMVLACSQQGGRRT